MTNIEPMITSRDPSVTYSDLKWPTVTQSDPKLYWLTLHTSSDLPESTHFPSLSLSFTINFHEENFNILTFLPSKFWLLQRPWKMDIPAAVRQNVVDQSILLLQRNVPALDIFYLVQGILCAPGYGHFQSGLIFVLCNNFVT